MATVPGDTPSTHLNSERGALYVVENPADETDRARQSSDHDEQDMPGVASLAGQTEAQGAVATVDDRTPGEQLGAPHDATHDAAGTTTFAALLRRASASARTYSDKRYLVLLAISIVALLVSLINFGLIAGALRIPTPGLQVQANASLRDTATYSFEFDTDGWMARGAATVVVWNNSHAFAGQGALEAQVAGLTQTQKAFIYITMPPAARPGSTVIAHLYVPSGAPPLIATVYALDGSWAWSSGAYPSLNPGDWIAVSYVLPRTMAAPIRELGVMIVGVAGNPPYTGPVFLDAVNIQR